MVMILRGNNFLFFLSNNMISSLHFQQAQHNCTLLMLIVEPISFVVSFLSVGAKLINRCSA